MTAGEDGAPVAHFHRRRHCNGCGIELGDLIERDVDDNGDLTDVRGECLNCAPLVKLEAAGCTTWHLTLRTVSDIAAEFRQAGVFIKGNKQYPAGSNQLAYVGIRLGDDFHKVYAYWGDWIIRRPDGRWDVHKGPAGSGR
jgi:hypothetical protein